jgi:hypothetical protein
VEADSSNHLSAVLKYPRHRMIATEYVVCL